MPAAWQTEAVSFFWEASASVLRARDAEQSESNRWHGAPVTTTALRARHARSSAEAGVEGNSRLTAVTGLVLTALLLVEGFTILNVRGYLTLHTFVGLALIGPLALKTVTTLYRFARYYTGKAAYVQRGAPPAVLRILGPLVILTSLAVVGTGVALLSEHGRSGSWLTLHQASFIAWIIVTGLHFLGHIFEAVRGTAREFRGGHADPTQRTRLLRLFVVTGSIAIGLVIAAVFTPSAASWQLPDHDHFGPPGSHIGQQVDPH
jgi:hypothetical protein